jgi:DNA (cytosine-5)-methyltransferase 1
LRAVCTFSCIGHHAIGLARAGITTTAFCELNPWRRDRIAEFFPGVPCHDDIATFKAPKAEIIIGGPPCQKTSVAAAIHGKRSGKSLWPEMLRIGIDMGAEWFVVEQPPGNAVWERKVGNSLRRAGFHVARAQFAACDVGAPYLRQRVFLVACTSLSRLEVAWSALPSAIESVKGAAHARGDWDADQLETFPVDARAAGEMDAGSRERREWIEALGDSNPPHMAEVIGRAIMAANSKGAAVGSLPVYGQMERCGDTRFAAAPAN